MPVRQRRPMGTAREEANHDPHKSDARGRDDVGGGGSYGTLADAAAQLNVHGPVKPGACSLSSVILSAFQK